MADRVDLGASLATVGGSVTLFGTYMYWVLRTDGLHDQPPTVVGMAIAHPLSVVGPTLFLAALGYAVGVRLAFARRGSRLERTSTVVVAVFGFLVALAAVSSMFFRWYDTAGSGLGPTGLLNALVFYPDAVLLLTVVLASPVYLAFIATKGIVSVLRAGDRSSGSGADRGGSDGRSAGGGRGSRVESTRTRPAPTASPAGDSSTEPANGQSVDGTPGQAAETDAGTFAGGPIPGYPSATWSALDVEQSLGEGRSLARTDEDERVLVEQLQVDETLHAGTVEDFVSDAETWESLASHDHVLGVVGYGTSPMPWLAVEYPDGGTLVGRTPLAFGEACALAVTTTDALRFAHNRGVTHGAVRPEHVAFRRRDGTLDVPKLGGWNAEREDAGSRPEYAAPEQFRDGPVDAATDVYRIGAVLYDAFTGRPPFEGEPTQVMGQALTERPTPPSEVNADLPAALDDVLLSALATDRSDRDDSVVYLRDGIADLASDGHS